MTDQPITLRPPRSVWIVTIVAAAVVLAFTVIAFRVNIEWWYRLAFLVFSALFPFAFAELALSRVTLGATDLIVINGFRRRVVPRETIKSVTWGKGVGVSVELVDNSWLKLPGVGRGNQAATNTIRAWIKRTSRSGAVEDR